MQSDELIEEKSEAIRKALRAKGRRTKGSEILEVLNDQGYKWVSHTVESWREQKPEGIVRSINLHIDKHMDDVDTEVFGNEALHTLREDSSREQK